MTKPPLRDRAQGRWGGVLPSLGIADSFLTGKHGPCPLCGGTDRWRYDNKDGRGTWICTKCGAGDGISLVMQRLGLEYVDAAKEIERVLGNAPVERPRRELSDAEKRDAMNKLWRTTHAITAHDPVGKYLRARIGLTGNFPSNLRCAPNVRCHGSPPTFHPAMIAMVRAPSGSPTILHRTYLTADGRKADVEKPKRVMPGTIAKGASVRLTGPAGELGIAEGIETALSATALTGVPCWAALNSAMLMQWEPPAETRHVVVFGDNDGNFAGQSAAYALARRVASASRTVEVRIPDQTDTDWNDVLARRKAEREGDAA